MSGNEQRVCKICDGVLPDDVVSFINQSLLLGQPGRHVEGAVRSQFGYSISHVVLTRHLKHLKAKMQAEGKTEGEALATLPVGAVSREEQETRALVIGDVREGRNERALRQIIERGMMAVHAGAWISVGDTLQAIRLHAELFGKRKSAGTQALQALLGIEVTTKDTKVRVMLPGGGSGAQDGSTH